MASPASSSMPPHSTTNVGPLNTAGPGGCAPLGALLPGGAPGGNPMYMLQWHEHHASFFRSVIVLIVISLHRLSHRVSHQLLGPKYVRAWSITLSSLEVKGLSNHFSLFYLLEISKKLVSMQ